MAKAPEDSRITDLARYKKAREDHRREAQRRREPNEARGPGLLGSNPRAALILVIIVVGATLLWLWPVIHRLI